MRLFQQPMSLRVPMVLLLMSDACLCSAIFAQSPTAKIPTTGRANPQLASFDRLLVGFLRDRKLPGAALAVAHNGRLVYARGYGYADQAAKEPVQPNSLFRIASISKPLTAAAVLQLVERGRLRLEARVFEVLQLKEPKGNGVRFDERWRQVTILHLLQHRGGWDRDKSFDPMFRSAAIVKQLHVQPPAKPQDIIRYMLRHPLEFDPGSKYAYSNFGYCLLGRVIEKVSGQGYEQYVRKEVLAPLGIYDMRVGATLLQMRAPHEVKYHVAKDEVGPAVMGPNVGETVPEPYGAWCLESMDSHGGWIASAPDLVRFASAFVDPHRCKILSAKSIAIMLARPPGEAGVNKKGKPRAAYYGCGWDVRPIGSTGRCNFWHGGLLDGTSTLLVNRHDGLTWAVLFNSSKEINKEVPAGGIDPLMHEAADAVTHWPR